MSLGEPLREGHPAPQRAADVQPAQARATRICLLGREEHLYTRMMLVELRERGVPVAGVVLERSAPSRQLPVERALSVVLKLLHPRRRSGFLNSVPVWHWYGWWKLLRLALFLRSGRRQNIEQPYVGPAFETLLGDAEVFRTKDINSADTYLHLLRQHYDFGVLSGVGIVSESILGCFTLGCLNAHPGPLPQCRGGGALEQTLAQGLAPAVSVHFAAAEVDGGPILAVDPVRVDPSEGFWALRWRCDAVAAASMARILELLLKGTAPSPRENQGVLHRWKDCTAEVQRAADRRLEQLRRAEAAARS